MSEELNRDYSIGDEIGRGRFGFVYRCYLSDSGEVFSIKSDKSLLSIAVDFECAEQEAKITQLACVGNPHGVRIHAVDEDEIAIPLVMDLCEGGDLFDRIVSCNGELMVEPEATAVITVLMEVLAICHCREVAHRDVKPDNVLLDGKGRLRLADFGSVECFGDGRLISGVDGSKSGWKPK